MAFRVRYNVLFPDPGSPDTKKIRLARSLSSISFALLPLAFSAAASNARIMSFSASLALLWCLEYGIGPASGRNE